MRSCCLWISVLLVGLGLNASPAAGRPASPPADFLGRVVGIPAADRLIVMQNGRPSAFQLYGIESPTGVRGDQARLYLKQMAESRSVHVIPDGRNAQGRRLARIEFIGGRNLSEELLRAGLARWDRRTAPRDWQLSYLERDAQRKKRGLWADGPQKPHKKTKKRN